MKAEGRESGFTLVEILIILAVVAVVVGGLALASAKGTAERRLACLTAHARVAQQEIEWRATVNPSSPFGDPLKCELARRTVELWNRECADIMPALPMPKCE